MLRWKTPSAICAIMITACPLTSFAQQIVKPAPPEVSILQPMGPIKLPGRIRKATYEPLVPLVSPQQAMAANPTLQPPGTPEARTAALNPLKPMPPIQLRNNPTLQTRTFSAKYRSPVSAAVAAQPRSRSSVPSQVQQHVTRAASPKVIIRTPFVQPHNPNNYLFMVENVGTVDATNASVELYVPEGVVIKRVVPATATNTAQRAQIRLTDLKAGSKSIIEVEVSPTTDVVEFQTRMSLESVHTFTTAANPSYVSRATSTAPATPVAPVADPASRYVIESQSATPIAVPAAAPTEVVSAIPLEPLPVPVKQVSQVSRVPQKLAPLTPLTRVAAAAPALASLQDVLGETSGRTGRAQPPNIANVATNNAYAARTQAASSQAIAAQVSADAQLTATVDGPVTLGANEETDFSITVTNPNQSEASGIIVQLTVPAGLKVTVLDRDAWFDEEHQTISWEIRQLGSGQQEKIQYKAVGQAIGQQNQKVTIGMQDVYQGKAQLVTLVSH